MRQIMISNLKIEKICEWCTNIFIAKTTVMRFCSNKCNSKAYKGRQRKVKASPNANITKFLKCNFVN